MNRLSSLKNQLTQNLTADLFHHVTEAAPDMILHTFKLYSDDTFPQKVNLGIGAYRDDDGNSYVFESVRKVQQELAEQTFNGKLNKEYLPIEGYQPFCVEAAKLMFGENNSYLKNGCIATVQSISGCGSLRIGFEFLKYAFNTNVYYPNPTWANHIDTIIKAKLNGYTYTYYDPKTKALDFEGMKRDISKMSPGSVVLLHVCAHNPTGVDPSPEQWRELANIVKEKKLFPYFDSAYQGFASGDIEQDAYSIKAFLDLDIQMIVAQSFSKNMGLYGERVGALHVVCETPETAQRVLSQLKAIIRPMYSNPPLQGARLAAGVLGNKQYKEQFLAELKMVSQRIIDMRKLLRDELVRINTPGNWDHIVNQIGMFSYTGLNEKQCTLLIEKYHVYLIKNGRISMAGVNKKNYKYLANSIKEVVETI